MRIYFEGYSICKLDCALMGSVKTFYWSREYVNRDCPDWLNVDLIKRR